MLDIDGTLVESFKFDEECYLDAVFQVLAHDMDSDWSKYEHVTDTGILDQHLKSRGLLQEREKIHRDVKDTFMSSIKKHAINFPIREIDGAKKFLKNIQKMDNVSLSIATGGWAETARIKLKSAGFDIQGIPMASSNDHFSRTEIMKIALEKSEFKSQNKITYFGDAEWDKKACEKLGFNFVLVGNRTTHNQNISNFKSYSQARSYIGL